MTKKGVCGKKRLKKKMLFRGSVGEEEKDFGEEKMSMSKDERKVGGNKV